MVDNNTHENYALGMNDQATASATWIHPFERSGLGHGPFECVDYEKRETGHGTSCDHCGTYIVHVYFVQDCDGKRFKVGCDCMRRTHDTQLIESIRRAEYAAERRERAAAKARWEASDEGQAEFARRAGSDAGHAFRRAEYDYDRAEQGKRSTHVGAVGERITLTLTTDKIIPLESAYGTKLLHLMADARGNRCVWFCSGGNSLDKGSTVTVKATVKEHGERDGVKQTVLTRVKAA